MASQINTRAARDLLAEITDDRERFADRLGLPWWYCVLWAALLALIVASQTLPGSYGLLALLPLLIGIVVLKNEQRKRSGVWIGGSLGARSRKFLWSAVATFGLGAIVARALTFTDAGVWWALLPTPVVFAAALFLIRGLDAAQRREIRAA